VPNPRDNGVKKNFFKMTYFLNGLERRRLGL
jgi:hypothetical protein